jgi:hypothetical protein
MPDRSRSSSHVIGVCLQRARISVAFWIEAHDDDYAIGIRPPPFILNSDNSDINKGAEVC